MSRVIILVADGLGVGSSADAEKFGDVGANTFFHIYEKMKQLTLSGQGHDLHLPNLAKLGLLAACEEANGVTMDLDCKTDPIAAYGYMQEISTGKDTPSGHWEMAGVPVLFDWGYFTEKTNSFPEELIKELVEKTDVAGILGNCHAPGTDILIKHGVQHIKDKMPICYTSADSVFQIAAHEEHFGLQRLYDFCEVARELLDKYNIGRVIARPFLGETPSEFKRTGNRRDLSVLPPSPTMLDKLVANGGSVTSIGKIADIYAHQGISESIKATGLEQLIDTTIAQMQKPGTNQIIFTNLVNFDQDFGHRRDIPGYAEALEYFDTRLAEIMDNLHDDDILMITADHGCDPSWVGTDHTREYVPMLAYQKNMQPVNLGKRDTFADMGQTIADIFNLPAMEYGQSFLKQLVVK
ncbi:phosphopentomutase [Psychrosphaera aquimarina]|uniref:Phosphopentomutase n=1 Tax=Psychrosphaera aquimarina TaxID=2044854 RepID=A0ABU3R4S5_9GAMM|nr:phosphopentomutase [Psychrosphaera aquimarina]MDU0114686.1 phosphopentomutase [Psychrosphaera aquimarina]